MGSIKTIKGYPPNIDAIRAAFGNATLKRAIFTYGDTVYVPDGSQLPDHLEAHEATHIKQQGSDPAGWWERYLADTQFRLEQELEAYQAQYGCIQTNYNRATRRKLFKKIAHDFSSALYGGVVDFDRAKELISG
jgi:hypothetical protein